MAKPGAWCTISQQEYMNLQSIGMLWNDIGLVLVLVYEMHANYSNNVSVYSTYILQLYLLNSLIQFWNIHIIWQISCMLIWIFTADIWFALIFTSASNPQWRHVKHHLPSTLQIYKMHFRVVLWSQQEPNPSREETKHVFIFRIFQVHNIPNIKLNMDILVSFPNEK